MEMVERLIELYKKRSLLAVEGFVNDFAGDEIIVDGTCVGEIYKGKEGLKDIIKSDLKYWYDLIIEEEYASYEHNGYQYIELNAFSCLDIHENAARYERFEGIMDEIIADDKLSTNQKAASISYKLDTLIANRKYKRRREKKPVGIIMVLKDGKIIFMNFYFKRSINDVDSFMHIDKDIDEYYQDSHTCMTGVEDVEIQDKLTEMGYQDVKINLIDNNYFYGLGYIESPLTLDQRLEELFHNYKKDNSYDSLYYLRMKISYLNEVYAYSKKPMIITKFNGFKDKFIKDDIINIIYPLFYYIETK